MMRLAIYAAVLAVAGTTSSWAEDCPGPSTITLSGTVHAISTMREEPQAQPETFFKILLKKPICGKPEVTANTLGPISCSEGQVLEATGRFTPPSEMFGIARLELQGPVICKADK